MHCPISTRRAAGFLTLLLALLLTACGSKPREYPPLTYDYLPQIRLNVASVEIDNRATPTGKDDVSALSPVTPADAIRRMEADRLKPFGNSGRAVLVIREASLIKGRDEVHGKLSVQLDVYSSDNKRAGFATAEVSQKRTGNIDDLRGTLYDLTKLMMERMNVELEYQAKRSLHDWIMSAPPSAVAAPVAQENLAAPVAQENLAAPKR